MKIYLIRHGETASNKAKRIMGQRINEPLNEEGLKQAQELTNKMKEYDYDLIFSSPQKRAMQTAEAINKNGMIPILQRDELKERDFGTLSGKSWEEMDIEMKCEPGTMRQRDFDQEYDYSLCEGEKVEDVKKRFLKFIDELKNNFSDKKVVIVAHGGILRVSHFLLSNEKVGHIDNAAIIEYEI